MYYRIKTMMEDNAYDQYANQDDVDNEMINEYDAELGSHQYMPREFIGMETKNLGFCIVGQKTPFMVLKDKLINEKDTLKVEDRMQGVRYLCNIPYNNAVYHCTEAALSIIQDPKIDIYKRFYFFDNKDKYFRLDDHVVQYLYPAFFKYGLKNPVEVPLELMVIAAKYILQYYGTETTIRQTVVDWILDIVEDEGEDVVAQIKVLEVLQLNGLTDEQEYAREQLRELGIDSGKASDFEDDESNQLALDILRALRTQYSVNSDDTPQALFGDLVKYCRQNQGASNQVKYIEEFFNTSVNEDTKFDHVGLDKIFILLQKCIQDQRTKSEFTSAECLRQLVDVICNPNEVGKEALCLLSVENFVTSRKLQLQPSQFERLRNDVFAGLNQSLSALNDGLREDVQVSRGSEDKSAAREFLVYFEDEKLLMYEKNYSKVMSQQEFDTMFDKIAEEWLM